MKLTVRSSWDPAWTVTLLHPVEHVCGCRLIDRAETWAANAES